MGVMSSVMWLAALGEGCRSSLGPCGMWSPTAGGFFELGLTGLEAEVGEEGYLYAWCPTARRRQRVTSVCRLVAWSGWRSLSWPLGSSLRLLLLACRFLFQVRRLGIAPSLGLNTLGLLVLFHHLLEVPVGLDSLDLAIGSNAGYLLSRRFAGLLRGAAEMWTGVWEERKALAVRSSSEGGLERPTVHQASGRPLPLHLHFVRGHLHPHPVSTTLAALQTLHGSPGVPVVPHEDKAVAPPLPGNPDGIHPAVHTEGSFQVELRGVTPKAADINLTLGVPVVMTAGPAEDIGLERWEKGLWWDGRPTTGGPKAGRCSLPWCGPWRRPCGFRGSTRNGWSSGVKAMEAMGAKV